MNISTLVKRFTLVAVLGAAGLVAGAQTFVYNGVIYKASGNKLTAQKAGTKVTVGEAGPTAYVGDIVIPDEVSYGGKTYTVTSIGSVFKGCDITSIVIGKTVTTISRGCFQGDTLLTKAVLPAELTKMNGDLFNGCVALKEISIPGKVIEISSNQFKGCVALEKLTFEDGPTALELSANAFPDNGTAGLKEVIINRAIGTKFTDIATKPFRGAPALEKVTIGGSFTNIPTSYFENTKKLTTVTFTNAPTEWGTNVFAGSGITEFTVPASLTTISSSNFQNCTKLKKVVLHDGLTAIYDMAFYGAGVEEINFGAGLTSIGQMAFSGTKLSGELVLPAALTRIGLQAFANNAGLTAVSVPASVTSIGDGAFMGCSSIAKYTVDAANTAYASDAAGTMITTADGKGLFAFAPKCASTELTGNFETVYPYAAYKAAGLAKVSLPACVNWGDHSFRGTAISELAVAGTVGRYVAADCPNLTKLTVTGAEVPFGIAANCAALTDVTFTKRITTVKQDAFLNCTGVKKLNLGDILAIIEADAFKGAGIEELTVGAANPAGMAAGVFTEDDKDITVKVPAEFAEAYRNANGWKYLNIVGDANVAPGPKDMGMPAGLYFANPDGKLYCAYDKSEGFDSYDVGGVPHTFQLAEFKNRIYGASAGKKFVYSATGAVDGDGKLFYISKVGGEIFQAVVLDNTGNNAYKDPFALYIYGDTLYVNDRNVCIRKIAADAIALPQDYPSWMENNWMGFYGSPWIYGCIKAGWAITQGENEKGDPEPVYWVGMKYNGNGIYRFKEKNIGVSADKPGEKPANGTFLTAINPIFTTFYLDEAHGQMYIYMETAGNEETLVKGGIYRIDISKLEANPDPSKFADLEPVLIDGSPVKYEGSSTNEHVGISQFAPDAKGEYLYWCYRAPTKAEAEANEAQDFVTQKKGQYWWADKFDENNPLHKTGIKRIKLGEANPTVEMVVPGAEGYGIVPVNYEGSERPAGVNDIVAVSPVANITVNGNVLTANEAATVVVYDMSGAMVAYAELQAGQSMSIAHLNAGAYIAVANGAAKKFMK